MLWFVIYLYVLGVVSAGSVLDNSLGVLIDRLRGLCDNSDVHPETFHDHEVVYILKDFNGKLTSSLSPHTQYLHNCTVLYL